MVFKAAARTTEYFSRVGLLPRYSLSIAVAWYFCLSLHVVPTLNHFMLLFKNMYQN